MKRTQITEINNAIYYEYGEPIDIDYDFEVENFVLRTIRELENINIGSTGRVSEESQ